LSLLPSQPAIIAPPPALSPGPGDAPITTKDAVSPVMSQPAPSPSPISQNAVRLSFKADRDKLSASFSPLANLADEAGEINVEITAIKPSGFDRTWLRNAVYEPLEEADIIGSQDF
jgi:hypothetical protein